MSLNDVTYSCMPVLGICIRVYDIQYMTYNVWGTMYDVQCMTYNVWRTMYDVQCMTYNVQIYNF